MLSRKDASGEGDEGDGFYENDIENLSERYPSTVGLRVYSSKKLGRIAGPVFKGCLWKVRRLHRRSAASSNVV